MGKLVEQETSSGDRSAGIPALAVQFFLIPLAVVAVVFSIYAGFRMLLDDERTAEDYLNDVRIGGRERRWPAAFELSRLLSDPEIEANNPTLGESLVRVFVESKGDDPRIRRYLALAVGRLQNPPNDAVSHLVGSLNDPDSETRISIIWALASLGDMRVVPELVQEYSSADAGIRKMAVYALGALDGDAQLNILHTALNDPAPDVQWNAAVALARHDDRGGLRVLRRMLDRSYLENTVTRIPDLDTEMDPVDEVIIGGLQAVAVLKEGSLREQVLDLSREDQSLRVRQVALDTLEELEDVSVESSMFMFGNLWALLSASPAFFWKKING